MSRFRSSDESEELSVPMVGRPMGGAFSCQECDKVSTEAVYVDRESKLVWTCEDGHQSSIDFKL